MVRDTTPTGADSSSARRETSDASVGRRRFLQVAGVAGATGLAGCGGIIGGSDGGDGTTELSYWTLFGGGDGEVMKAIIDRFNEERPLGENVSINRQRTPWEEHYNRLYTAMTGGNPPDIAISHASYLRRFKPTLTDISGLVSSNDYVESILSACEIDGGQYAVPLDSHPVGLYYNVDLLTEAGVEPPIEDFAQFEEACNAVRENTDAKPFSPDVVWGGGGGMRAWFMGLHQYGGQMFNDDRSEAVFGGDAGTNSLEFMASVSGERNWDIPDISENRVTQSFQNGNVAMTLNGTWYVNVMRDVGFEWGFDKPRVFPETRQLRSSTDSHTLVVPKKAGASEERVQAAVSAAEWITQQNPSWGAEAGHLPAYNPILNGDQLRNADIWNKTLQPYMEMAQDDQLAYFPQLPSADFYGSSNWTWISDTYAHNLSVQEAIQQGVQTWNSNVQ